MRSDIVAAVQATNTTGASGKVAFDQYGDTVTKIFTLYRVSNGKWTAEESPLRGAPHTAETLVGEWDKAYDRELAVYPAGVSRKNKYWPPVRRIDGARGDRNLVCSCPPLNAYEG